MKNFVAARLARIPSLALVQPPPLFPFLPSGQGPALTAGGASTAQRLHAARASPITTTHQCKVRVDYLADLIRRLRRDGWREA
jgi:hypothetical protein